MDETTTPAPIIRRRIGEVQHFAGARLTRVAYVGVADREDGTKTTCPHSHGHKTQDAAATCAGKIR